MFKDFCTIIFFGIVVAKELNMNLGSILVAWRVHSNFLFSQKVKLMMINNNSESHFNHTQCSICYLYCAVVYSFCKNLCI